MWVNAQYIGNRIVGLLKVLLFKHQVGYYAIALGCVREYIAIERQRIPLLMSIMMSL
jgi:hypothetical protein